MNINGVERLGDTVPGVASWWCDLDRRADDVTALERTLSASEHERAARFGPDMLRRRWIAGRGTLRELLGALLHTTPAAVPLRRGRRGRPELAIDGAPDFNVSHTQGVAIIAIGTGLGSGVRIGVDVEHVNRAVGADRLAHKLLTVRERAALAPLDADERRRRFLRMWTCKEAMSKATADGLIAPFREIDVDIDDAPRLVGGPAPYEPRHWQLVALPLATNHFASLAIWSR